MRRTTKEDFVKKHIDAYLKGKNDEERESFLAKPMDRIYGTLQAWKRRAVTKAARETVGVDEIISEIKCATLHIGNLKEMNDKEEKKLRKELEALRVSLENFEEIRKANRINALKKEQERIARQIEELEK